MIKTIAIILNFVLVVFFLYLAWIDTPKEEEWILFLFFLLFPVINLIALFKSKEGSWLELFLKRKALEEQRKISELKNKEPGLEK